MDQYPEENTCRICFKIQDTLFSLFRKTNGASPYEKLLDKTKLTIELNDVGPSSICSQCLIELDTTVNFLEKCEKSNEILASRLTRLDGDEQSNFKDLNGEGDVEQKGDSVEIVENECEMSTEVERCPECGSRRRCRHWSPPATHTCNYCHKVFTRKFNYNLHVKRHLGEREWSCPTCGSRHLTRWLAQRHCAPRPRRACPEPGCGKTFTTNTNLHTHIRVHNGERPFECNECGKTFTSKNTLNDHIRIHTGAMPYICPVCGKRFRTNKLSAHMWSHSGQGARPLACPRVPCARRFSSPRALHAHAAVHAHGPPPRRHACSMCAATYSHKQSLNKHVRKNHKQKPDFPPDINEKNASNQEDCNLSS